MKSSLLPAGALFWAVLALSGSSTAEEPAPPSPARGNLSSLVHWQLNPAGQLVLWFDSLGHGNAPHRERHTVRVNDRAPKLCGDPDGTGRYTWFFTDALMIERAPVPDYEAHDSQSEISP